MNTVDKLVATEAQLDAMKQHLSAKLDALGKQISALAWTFGLLYPTGLIILGLFLK